MGSCGECDRYRHWNARATYSKDHAELLCLILQNLADSVKYGTEEYYSLAKNNPFDPLYRSDWGGTAYWVTEMEIS